MSGTISLTDAIRASGLVQPGDRLVVGVSGGPDSLALLHALAGLGKEWGLTLCAAHVDHQLREGSAAEGEVVGGYARSWGVEPVLRSADVPTMSRHQKLSLEQAARRARYEILGSIARERGCDRVAVAHTADDQVETVLLNLLRGGGLAGIAGMPARRPLHPAAAAPTLVRPLLAVRRGEVLAYCESHGISALQDPSNRSRRFTRNRVRLDLLPLLEREYNPRVRERLLDLASIARAQTDLRDHLAGELLEAARITAPPGEARFDLGVLLDRPPALVADALRAAFAEAAGPGVQLDAAATRRALRLVGIDPAAGAAAVACPIATGSRRTDLVAGWRAEAAGSYLYLGRREPGREPDIRLPLPIPGRLDLAQDRAWIAAEWAHVPDPIPVDAHVAYVDPMSLAGPLVVRRAWPGARFRPLGMRQSKKLSDFLIDRKVPRPERARVPLVVDPEKIVWVAGLALDDRVRLTPATRDAIRLQLGSAE